MSFTGTGADADGDTLTYAWDFTNDGTIDATTANASHTYDQPGEYTARFTVSDGERSRSVLIDIDAYPPLASCPGNDEFDGTSLDTARWSVVRRDDQFLTVEGGSLNINAQPGEDISPTARRASATSCSRTCRTRALDGDRARDLEPDRQLPERRARDLHGRRELDQERHGVERRAHVRGVQGAQQHAVRPRLGDASDASFPSTFYVRFTSDGTTIQAQRSADGQTWTNTGTATNLSGLTNPKVGMYATASTAAGTQANTARFDYFTLDAPQEPSDEFDGTSLNPCRWSQIVRHEPGGYTVGGGNLTLPAAHGDFFANAPNNNPNIILQPAPSGPGP